MYANQIHLKGGSISEFFPRSKSIPLLKRSMAVDDDDVFDDDDDFEAKENDEAEKITALLGTVDQFQSAITVIYVYRVEKRLEFEKQKKTTFVIVILIRHFTAETGKNKT